MRYTPLAAATLASAIATTSQAAAPKPSGPVIKLACSGPAFAAARQIAVRAKLALALQPQACLARTSMYGGGSKQIIAASPAASCGHLKAIQIYERATSGTWGNILEKPVCGTNVSFGPNNPWGAIMITIDGRHYDQRGAYYTPVNY